MTPLMRMRTLLASLAVAALSLACSHPWYLVESRFVASTRSERPPEVTGTTAYRTRFSGPLQVALRAPDSCADQTAAEAKGKDRSKGTLIRTTCGVEMAELERALAQAGYTVSSWNAVRSIVSYDKVTPRVAAQQLGAQILFQVNSLEQAGSDPGRDQRWERRFYESNEEGEKRGEAFVPEARALRLEQIVAAAEKDALPAEPLAATVNASAVDVETGETIWFYEWTRVEKVEFDETASRLVLCNRSEMSRCPVVRNPRMRVEQKGRAGGMSAVSSGPRDQDLRKAVYHELVREVVQDLVQRFTEGRL